jgi:NADH-quinone oxidoreductase subunit G
MMIHIIIDNKVVNVLPNITVMQACLEQKIDIPRFCYHERLSIAGHVVCVWLKFLTVKN